MINFYSTRIQKYLYLNSVEHVNAWVNGGAVPLSLASRYKHLERKGTRTPDENRINDFGFDPATSRGLYIRPGGKMIDVTFNNVVLDGKRIPNVKNGNYFEEDGLILCLCNSNKTSIAEKFGGKKACVCIDDVEALFKSISRQLNTKGKMGPCSYTRGYERNHFLKHKDDAWQEEYRLFWKAAQAVEVQIPPNTARLICTY